MKYMVTYAITGYLDFEVEAKDENEAINITKCDLVDINCGELNRVSIDPYHIISFDGEEHLL